MSGETVTTDHSEIELYEEALELRRSILCIICLEVYNDPVVLPCSHTFCRPCILEASRTKSKCPVCAADFLKRSIRSGIHIGKAVNVISALIDSLTNKARYSVDRSILDDQCRVRRQSKIQHNRNTVTEPTFPSQVPMECSSSFSSQLQQSQQIVSSQEKSENLDKGERTIQTDNNNISESLEKLQCILDHSGSDQSPDSIIEDKGAVTLAEDHKQSSHNSNDKETETECKSVEGVECKNDEIEKAEIRTIPEQPLPIESLQKVLYRPGEVVQVLTRSWPGMNKPGGAAWILAIHEVPAMDSTGIINNDVRISYDVKYVLHGNSDLYVPDIFIVKFQELERKSRKRGLDIQLIEQEKATEEESSLKEKVKAEKREERIRVKNEKQLSDINKNENNLSENNNHGTKKLKSTENLLQNKKEKKTQLKVGTALKEPPVIWNDRSKVSTIKFILPTSLDQADFEKLEHFRDLFCTDSMVCNSSGSSGTSHSQNNSQATTPSNPLITLIDKFDESVTHVVVPVDKKGTLKKRTLKFMQAILGGVWIVSSRWISDSISAGRVLDEESYEVARCQKAIVEFAPKRARLNVQAYKQNNGNKGNTCQGGIQSNNNDTTTDDKENRGINIPYCNEKDTKKAKPSGSIKAASTSHLLFHNTVFLLHGSFPNSGPTRSQIKELLRSGQATVVSSISSLYGIDTMDIGSNSRDLGPNSRDLRPDSTCTSKTLEDLGSRSSSNSSPSHDVMKIVICTDKLSVLTFLEELSALYATHREEESSYNSDMPSSSSTSRALEINLKISDKYPVEDSQSYLQLIEGINAMSENILQNRLRKLQTDDSSQLDPSIGSKFMEDRGRLMEITLLNPTWVFDSIANYSLLPTA